MALPKWLQILELVGPIAIAATVPGGQVIAPLIVTAIKSAEQLQGADGPTKRAHALEIVNSGAQVAAQLGAKLDANEVTATAGAAIDTTVGVINIINKAKTETPAAPAA